MKALCITQPWAELIASGRKTIETRVWATKYRGPLLIVATKPKGKAIEQLSKLPVGVAVAVVNLVDCRMMAAEDELAACCKPYNNARSWLLSNVRRIDHPFPVKGRLGIFEVEVPKIGDSDA